MTMTPRAIALGMMLGISSLCLAAHAKGHGRSNPANPGHGGLPPGQAKKLRVVEVESAPPAPPPSREVVVVSPPPPRVVVPPPRVVVPVPRPPGVIITH